MKRKAYAKRKGCPGKLSAAALLAVFLLCLAVFAGCGKDSPEGRYYIMDVQVQEYPQIKDKKVW